MYDKERGLYIAHCEDGPVSIIGNMANRHGLIAGATGTGKTVTLQVMAETFCQAGVPCFMADMKGDLSGISQAGRLSGFIEKRMGDFGISDPQFQGCPVRFFDVFGEQGHPMRATVSDMGPQLLSRLMGLNETQEGVLTIVFRIADDRGLLLLDMKDLRAMLNYVAQNAAEYRTAYGNISAASVGAIQRALLQTEGGKGVMNVLAADKLMLNPKLYSTFLLWLMSDLYASLPEVGDQPLPRLVFFFDEAHMLFDGTSEALVDKIEQVIRLIRSKGVGIYFVTQNPTDIPDVILSQLGNRVQHALRAFTPKDQKAVRVAAATFRANPKFKTEDAITNLGTGEALVSFLDEKGAPSVVQKAKILFPLSQIGAITPDQRSAIIKGSRLYGKYDTPVDRQSAFEDLLKESREAEQERQAEEEQAPQRPAEKQGRGLGAKIFGAIFTAVTASVASSVGSAVSNKVTGKKSRSGGVKNSAGRAVKAGTSAATRTLTRELTRSILGNLIK